jgi:hypothetical protein
MPRVPAGFLNARYAADFGTSPGQHLPANARGALFWMAGTPYYWLRHASVPDTYFVADMPHPLDPRDFLLIEQPGSRRLGVKIEPVSVHRSKARYLIARDPRLARCISENFFSLDGCALLERDAAKLLASGAFQDVTDAVRHAYGLFRIAPVEGFTPGREYRISFIVAHPKNTPFAYPSEMVLSIDRTPVLSWPSQAGRLRASRQPRDIYPDEDKAVYVDYLLARDLLPYRQSVYLTTEVNPPPAIRQWPPCGIQNPLGTGPGGRPLRFADGQCHRVQGKMGFFELADGFVDAAQVGANCPDLRSGRP